MNADTTARQLVTHLNAFNKSTLDANGHQTAGRARAKNARIELDTFYSLGGAPSPDQINEARVARLTEFVEANPLADGQAYRISWIKVAPRVYGTLTVKFAPVVQIVQAI